MAHRYYRGHIYIIDVSQSVEHDHPNAIVFLRSDISNVTSFFRKHGVSVMTMLELFNFITDVTIDDSNVDAYLEKLQNSIASRPALTSEQQTEEVFKQSFIPRNLEEVVDIERDMKRGQAGDTEGVRAAHERTNERANERASERTN